MSNLSMRAQWARRVLRGELVKELALHKRYDGSAPRLGDGLEDVYDLPPDPSQPAENQAPRAQTPLDQPENWPELKACIVGAGIAGLYTAMILDSLEIPSLTYEILESSDAPGGRVKTHYFPPEKGISHKHMYYDIGAMRFPKIPTMDRTFDLFRRTWVPQIKYYLGSADGAVGCPSLYNDILYVAEPNVTPPPDVFKVSVANGGVVPDSAINLGPDDILDSVFGEYKKALKENFEEGFKKLMGKDKYTTREYLRTQTPYDDYYTIQWLETMGSASGLYDQAFSESVIDSFDFDFPGGVEEWVCIEGGTSLVIDGMLKLIKTKPEIKKRVAAISIDRSKVANANMLVQIAQEAKPRVYSTVFNTTTLACMQRMDLRGAELHPVQKDAIRALHYDSSSKVAIVFSNPWWITKSGIIRGGAASTDLPIRTCVYPSYNLRDGPNKPAVLLCSYTWAQDAQRVGSLIGENGQGVDDELLQLMLRDLARLHADHITYEELKSSVIKYHAFDWSDDPNTSGAFALFGPGQFQNLYPFLSRPTADGNLHIVGEASSTHHAWIVGALDSAMRGVFHFLKKYQQEDTPMRPHWDAKIQLLKDIWGSIDEMETGPTGTAHLQVTLGRLPPKEQLRV